jgi:peptidoglycan/LPS O-acetylase OafA/YrhL
LVGQGSELSDFRPNQTDFTYVSSLELPFGKASNLPSIKQDKFGSQVNPVSPLPAIICVVIAMATCFLLMKRFGKPLTHDRYTSLDGLRGYLAFFVFLHHSSVWYFYLHSGQWELPPSNLYTHFGQSSVALFFMITGFLFFSKLIDGRTREIDWAKLFVSRFLRLVPLYVFAIFTMFLIVVVITHGTLNEPFVQLIKGAIRWLGFTVLGNPDLNGVPHTSTIVAGVTWSLPYELFFYLSLPLLALTVGVKPPAPYLLLGIVTTIGLVYWHPHAHHLFSFTGGIAAAFLVRSAPFRRFASSTLASFVCAVCLLLTVEFYPTAYGNTPLMLLSSAFILIACGNTLFGLLAHPVSRTLGEMAYSIYLLHGLTLFTAFHLLIGSVYASEYSPLVHWCVVAIITPVLVFVSFMTFRLIESPAMLRTKSTTEWLRIQYIGLSKLVFMRR